MTSGRRSALRDESAGVPLIICVPGKKPAVCHSLVELIDLYPTISGLCGLEVPGRLQGKRYFCNAGQFIIDCAGRRIQCCAIAQRLSASRR